MAKAGNKNYFHMENFLKAQACGASIRGDMPKLQLFGLIQKQGTDKNGNKAGYYRITEKGFSFANNEVTVPRYVNIYNNKVYGYSEEHTDIVTALADKFNYEELMGTALNPV